MMATSVTEQRPPAVLPSIGEPIKVVIKRLIMIFPKVSPNTTAEIDPEVWALSQYAKAAAASWEEQARLAEIKIRQAMGDAEKGTVNGVVVVKRHQVPVEAHPVAACTKDYIQAATK
jgi:hypothetical protein